MKVRRTRPIVFATLMALAAGGASWYAVRLVRPSAVVLAARDGVPPIPDLSRWPGEFRQRLESASRESLRSRDPAKPLTELAELYLANNFSAEAERVLRALRRLDPRNARTTYFLGRIVLRNENLPEAETLLLETTRLQPDYAPAWLQLGNVRMRGQRFDEARDCFERRLALVPNDPEATFAVAVLDRSRGATAAAIERLEAFLRVHPRLQEQRQMLVEMHEAAGDMERAAFHRRLLGYAAPSEMAADPWMDELREASYDPTQLYLFGLRGVSTGSFENARRILEKAARLSPDDEAVYGVLAAAYLGLGQTDDARSLLQGALVRLPGSDALHERLAEVWCAQKKPGDAVELLQRRMQASPKNPDLHYALGRALDRAGRAESAIASFAEALRLNPVSTEARLDFGRCLLNAGRRAEAKEQFVRALAMRPDHRAALELLADLELQDGNLDDAERHVDALRDLGPDEPNVRRAFATIKFRKANFAAQSGRNEEAEKLYRSGIAVDPTFGPIHGGLGMLWAKGGNLAAAMDEFKRFAELAPTDATAYLLIGSAHAQAGRAREAREAYERGLAIARKADDKARSAQFERLLAQ